MSGSVLAPWAHQVNPKANARILANNLHCFEDDATSLLQCLQVTRSAFVNVIKTYSIFMSYLSHKLISSVPFYIILLLRTSQC